MVNCPDEMTIEGMCYVKKGLGRPAQTLDGMPYVIVRSHLAGVHAGYLKSRNGQEAELVKARRLWRWFSRFELCDLSVNGTASASNCRFSCVVDSVTILTVGEILPCTEKARVSLQAVPVWTN